MEVRKFVKKCVRGLAKPSRRIRGSLRLKVLREGYSSVLSSEPCTAAASFGAVPPSCGQPSVTGVIGRDADSPPLRRELPAFSGIAGRFGRHDGTVVGPHCGARRREIQSHRHDVTQGRAGGGRCRTILEVGGLGQGTEIKRSWSVEPLRPGVCMPGELAQIPAGLLGRAVSDPERVLE
jgi:hypothetical protein